MGKLAREKWRSHLRVHKVERRAVAQQERLEARALELARIGVDTRLEGLNELREEFTRDRGEFLTHDEYGAKHDVIVTRVESLEKIQASLAGRDKGVGITWTAFLSIVTIALSLGVFLDKVVIK